MIDRVDQLALSSNDEHFPERFGYKYVASRQDDGWAEGITVETLLSPIDDETFIDGSLYFEEPGTDDETSAEQPAEESADEDVEVAQLEEKTAPKKSAADKSGKHHNEDGARDNKSKLEEAEEQAIGSGAPIDLNPADVQFDQFAVDNGAFEGFSLQGSLLNTDSFAGQLETAGAANSFQDLTATQATPIEKAPNFGGSTKDPTPAKDASIIVVNSNIDAATLNLIIANADAGSTIIMQDGIYTFDQCILIDRGDITLKGESENDTVIQFNFSTGQITDGIKINGGEKTRLGVADSEITEGSNSLVFHDNNLTSGDTIYLFQPNTREWLDANGWQNVSMEDADHRPFRETILEVDHVDGDIVYFTHTIPYAMDNGEARIYQIDLLDNISLSDFTVTYDLGKPDAYDFSNTQLEYSGTSAISVVGTNDASIEHISILDFASKGLVIGSSIDLEADDIHVSGSHNKGGGGNGYGVLLFETNNSSLTNLEILNTRHSLVTSAWSAETDNSIHIANTNRDIGFLGSPDRGNVVSVDNITLDFDVPLDGNGGVRWTAVSGGGSNHAKIDPFAENSIEFGHGEGSNRNDKLVADDSGAYLNGKYGYDTLIGGDGNDYLVGGTRNDTLTGGEGSDTFLLRVGDALDTITDFEFGAGGDTLLISDQPFVDSFDDLFLYTKDGNARVVYGRNSTVILEGVDIADINPANFSFDPTGDITAANYFGSDFEIA